MTNQFTSKKLVLAVTAAWLGAALLTGCSTSDQPPSKPTGTTKTITHVWGETPVTGTPTRVVTLEYTFVDELYALGVTPVGTAGTGNTKVPDYLAEYVTDFTYVGERKEPNLELIRSVSPDLILAAVDRHKMIKNELQEIAPTLGLDDDSYQEVLKNTEMLGDLLGKQEEADKVKTDLEEKINKVKAQIEGKPTVLVVGAFEDDFSVWVKDSFIGTLMSAIGTDYPNVVGKDQNQIEVELAKLSVDELAALNPEYLFIYGDLKAWQQKPAFQNLKAVKENKVITVDRNLWSRGRGPIAASKILDQALPVFTNKK